MGITVNRTETQPIPAGLYEASVESIEQAEGQFGPQIKTKFLIEEEGFEGKTLTGWASLTFSPKSKLYGWVRAAVFGGKDIPTTYRVFDSDHLIGRRVFLSVTTEKGSDGEVYNKVKDVLPYRTRAAQPAPNAQPRATQAPATVTPEPPPLNYDAIEPPADDAEE